MLDAGTAHSDGEGEPQPSARAQQQSDRCEGIHLHQDRGRSYAALEFDRAIISYALNTFGEPRSCKVEWQFDEGTGSWFFNMKLEFPAAKVRVTELVERFIVELVADERFPDARAAREALASQDPEVAPEWQKLKASSSTDKHGIRWVSYAEEDGNDTWELGFRGNALVGIRWSVGS